MHCLHAIVMGLICCAISPGEQPDVSAPQIAWRSLFDGKSLQGWTVSEFGGEGEVEVADDQIVLHAGAVLTGITYSDEAKLPKMNYEIRLEAKRVNGNDFFCGLTVPYADSHFSLIVGGWGGGLVGLSSLDNDDAANNETSSFLSVKDGKWYRIRLEVRKQQIRAWIDNECIVNCQVRGRKVSTRPEVDLSKPLGISTYQTTAALRGIELRVLQSEEE